MTDRRRQLRRDENIHSSKPDDRPPLPSSDRPPLPSVKEEAKDFSQRPSPPSVPNIKPPSDRPLPPRKDGSINREAYDDAKSGQRPLPPRKDVSANKSFNEREKHDNTKTPQSFENKRPLPPKISARPKPPNIPEESSRPLPPQQDSTPSFDRPLPPKLLTKEDSVQTSLNRPLPPTIPVEKQTSDRPLPPQQGDRPLPPKTDIDHQSSDRPSLPKDTVSGRPIPPVPVPDPPSDRPSLPNNSKKKETIPVSTKNLPHAQRMDVLKQRLREEYSQQKKQSLKGKISWLLHLAFRYIRLGVYKSWKLWEALWFKAGYGMRTFMVIVTVLFLTAFVGAFLQSGKKVAGIDSNVPLEKLTFQWNADPPIASELDQIYHSMKNIPFKVTGYGNIYTWYPKFGVVQQNLERGNSTLYTNQGVKKIKDAACWREAERGDHLKPDVRDILLFMNTDNTWTQDDDNNLHYETKKFGTLGEGSGEVFLSGSKDIEQFTFTKGSGITSKFVVEELDPDTEGPEEIQNCV